VPHLDGHNSPLQHCFVHLCSHHAQPSRKQLLRSVLSLVSKNALSLGSIATMQIACVAGYSFASKCYEVILHTCAMLPLAIGFMLNQSNTSSIFLLPNVRSTSCRVCAGLCVGALACSCDSARHSSSGNMSGRVELHCPHCKFAHNCSVQRMQCEHVFL
jgi:hypothetical protein